MLPTTSFPNWKKGPSPITNLSLSITYNFMKKSLLIAIVLLIGGTLSAQSYKQAAGLRLGYGVTATYKTFVSATNALDFEAGISFPSGVGIYASGAYEWHWSLNVDGLYVYAGPGASLGLTLGEHSSFGVGIMGVAGIEYTLPSVPLSFAIDYKPTLNLIPDIGGGWNNGGLSIRYTF